LRSDLPARQVQTTRQDLALVAALQIQVAELADYPPIAVPSIPAASADRQRPTNGNADRALLLGQVSRKTSHRYSWDCFRNRHHPYDSPVRWARRRVR